MQLEIIKQPDISLNELTQRQAEGFSVMRSAHAGNARIYNQVLAQAGVNMLLVDHNVTGIDKNYRPEDIISDSSATPIAEFGQLVMRTQVTTPKSTGQIFLDELHTDGLTRAFEYTHIQTNTEYLRANESIVAEIINISASVAPELFKRKVQTGETQTTPTTKYDEVKANNILQLKDNPRQDAGILIPNEVDILANFIIEALSSARDVQYHISGPDMIQYIKGIMPTLEKLYSAIITNSSFIDQIPDKLTVELVPGTALRFASTKTNSSNIKKLALAVSQLQTSKAAANITKKDFFSSNQARDMKARNALLTKLSRENTELTTEMINSTQLCPEIFDNGQDIPAVTQYDTLQDGGLFVPEIFKELTMSELIKLYKIINRPNLTRDT